MERSAKGVRRVARTREQTRDNENKGKIACIALSLILTGGLACSVAMLIHALL